MRRVAVVGMLWISACVSMSAQTPSPDRPGPYVIDVRGATLSLPDAAAFFPSLPRSTAIPSQGYGIDAGAHIYLLQLGPARLGIGGMFLRVRGTAASSAVSSTGSTASSAVTTPAVATLVTTVSPQLSVNFGSKAGWSYLSAGVGRTEITTRSGAFTDTATQGQVVQARLLDSGALSNINFGGGARWFAKSHLAFSFDVRFHMLGAGGETTATPGSTLVAVSAGLSLK